MSKRRTHSPEFKARVAMEVFDDNLVEGSRQTG
jgi:transposase-like protein